MPCKDNTTCPEIPEGHDCTNVRLDIYKVGKKHLQERMHVPRVKKSGETYSWKVDAMDTGCRTPSQVFDDVKTVALDNIVFVNMSTQSGR